MAALIRRAAATVRPTVSFARTVTTTTSRCAAADEDIPGDSKKLATGITGRIPDETEQATGLERKELNAMLAGDEDPFGLSMEPKYGARGTREAPRIIPSHFDARIVGICDEDNEQIHYFELKTGEPQVVMGEYFQLQKVGDEVLG